MAKYRVGFTFRTTDATTGAALVTAIEALLATKTIFATDTPVVTRNDAGVQTVVGDIRFASSVEATTFSTELQTLMTTDPTVLSGSRRSQHVCPAEESRSTWYDCRTDVRAEYIEATK